MMKKAFVVVLFVFMVVGCRQKEEPKPVSQFPTGPIQSVDDTKILKEAAQKDPKNVEVWIKLGNAMMDTRRFTEAIDAYQKALQITPNNTEVMVDMGTCYRYSGNSDRAVQEYRKALKINPNHVIAHKNLGVTLAYDLKDIAGGIKEFEKALELDPKAHDAAALKEEIQKLKSGK
jgi:cytochrome c-type biogenesis protein CcmH/NrfG